jgi:hypothetical protein
MIGVIIIAVLAVCFVALLWVRSARPGDQEPRSAPPGDREEGLGPESVFGPSLTRPPLGTPESLDSHLDPDWVDKELQRSEHHDS